MIERRKTKVIAAKRWRARRGVSLFNKEERNYESDTRDKTDLDQVNDKYLLQLWDTISRKL